MQLPPLRFWLFNGGILFYLLASGRTAAQIVPDTTLPNNSVVPPNCINCEITGGTIRGSNLFHSFEQFSIPTGGSASFQNDLTIENIITRVTGQSISDIDGLISANGKANLFLINPNGIIFGSNASLNIGGSFIVSTASKLKFADGTEFNATTKQPTPLLTVSVPVGLQFGVTPEKIINRAAAVDNDGNPLGLQVQSGQTLALVGGEVALEGGFLTTPGGRIELGSVAGNSLVRLSQINERWVLGYEGIQNFQDITLSQAAFAGSSDFKGADIQIQGRSVTVTEGSQVRSDANTDAQVGDFKVSASELVKLVGTPADQFFTGLFNEVQGEATGEGRTLTIETGHLTVQGGAQVSASTFGSGRGVDLTVNAWQLVHLEGNSENFNLPSGVFARVQPGATGDGGTITINIRQLIIKQGAQISTDTLGAGRAGNLIVRASESVQLEGRTLDNQASGLFAQVGLSATGNGGDLSIETGQMSILGGAQISTSGRSGGQGGNLTINARDSILVSGTSPIADDFSRSNILVSAEPGATRDAGKLEINTGLLAVENGARISADNFGIAQGGTATINVRQLLIQNGGEVRAGSLKSPQGIAGGGAGGTLTVNATDSVDVIGTGNLGGTTFPSTLFTQTQTSGNAGNLTITTDNLNVQNGAEVTVSSTGTGQAGNLTIQASTVRLDNAKLIGETTSNADGGNITLNLRELLALRNTSRISTSAGTASARGNGGNIKINAPFIVSAPNNNSDITANAFSGRGGRVDIDATGIFYLVPRSREELVRLLGTTDPSKLDPVNLLTNDITAISQENPSLSGTVIINTPDVDPSRGLLQLPSNLVDPSNQIAQGCTPKAGGGMGSFVATGRGGIPPSPTEPLTAETVNADWITLDEDNQTQRGGDAVTRTDEPTEIVEAQGWVVDADGGIVLVAQAPPTQLLNSPRLQPSACPLGTSIPLSR
jgi:filamentous hemagglutinin family protein